MKCSNYALKLLNLSEKWNADNLYIYDVYGILIKYKFDIFVKEAISVLAMNEGMHKICVYYSLNIRGT
jgi:hypothetical protein